MDNKNLYWLGSPPEFEAGYDEVIETDVVVCGAGIAGVPAARAAVEAGAECVLLEKSDRVQARSGQFALIGGEFLKRWGIDNAGEAGEIVAHLMRDNCYRTKQPIYNYFTVNIGVDFDWYLDGLPKENTFIANHTTDLPPKGTRTNVMLMKHPPQKNYNRTDELYPIYPYTIQFMPSHLSVLKGNLSIAETTGRLRVCFQTPAKKLLRDSETGRITGVIAQSYDGRLIFVKARKGVVLATGDYSGNRDMLSYYCPSVADSPTFGFGLDPEKKPINTGDGHRMGLWIGAKMETGPHAINSHNMGGAMGVTPYLQLDLSGRRFVNEDCPGQQLQNQITLLKGQAAWQFFDSGWPEQIPFMPVCHGSCSHILDEKAVTDGSCNSTLSPMDGYASQRFIDKSVERGNTLRADTLEELVEKTGLPKEAALSSIMRYNDLAADEDKDFGKRASRMFALEKPPYYASKITASDLLCCHGGLESDEEARCYDENLDVIPGLYVAGNIQGNRFAVEYATTLPGLSHSLALSFGRKAGENAAHGV